MWWKNLTAKEMLTVINALLSSDQVIGYKGLGLQRGQLWFAKNTAFNGYEGKPWGVMCEMDEPLEEREYLNPKSMWYGQTEYHTISPKGKEMLLFFILIDLFDIPGKQFTEKQILLHRISQLTKVIQRLLG